MLTRLSIAVLVINKSEGGFRDRDLYPAGAGLDAKVTKVATEGKIAEVSYLFPRPGPDKTPVPKVAYVTRAGNQVCLVGYYK